MENHGLRTAITFLVIFAAFAILGGAVVATSYYGLEVRALGVLLMLAGVAALSFSFWRDTVTLSKGAVVASMIMLLFSGLSLVGDNGTAWPLAINIAVCGGFWWLMARPPGSGRRHELLDSGAASVNDYEGIHFVFATAKLNGNFIELEGTFENCWSGERKVVVTSGRERSSVTLAPLETRRATLSWPTGSSVDPRGLVLNVESFGLRGRRVKPRRGKLVTPLLTTAEKVVLALHGEFGADGGVRVRFS